MSDKYKSLEHKIRDIVLKESIGLGGTEKYSGMPSFSAYKGKGVEQGAARNKSLQSRAQPYGNFEGGLGPQPLSTPKPTDSSLPNYSGGGISDYNPGKELPRPKDPELRKFMMRNAEGGKSIVPNQGDAPSLGDLSARGAAEGGKKKIKEDADTNISLIKKGSMMNSGPLTRFTNPLGDNGPAEAPKPEQSKPTLSFQTPDLSGKDGDLQTPKPKDLQDKDKDYPDPNVKLKPGKLLGKGKTDTQMDKSVTAPKKQLPNVQPKQAQVLPFPMPGLGTAPPPAGPGAGKAKGGSQEIPDMIDNILQRLGVKSPPKEAPSAGDKTNSAFHVMDPENDSSGAKLHQKPGEKYVNPPETANMDVKDPNKDYPAPGEALKPHKFTDQKQATSPVQAAGQSGISDKPNVLGKDAQKNTTTGDHAKAAQDGTERAHERRNDAVGGKSPATLPPLNASPPNAAGVAGPIQTQTPAQSRAGPSQKKQEIFSSPAPAEKTKPRVEFQKRADIDKSKDDAHPAPAAPTTPKTGNDNVAPKAGVNDNSPGMPDTKTKPEDLAPDWMSKKPKLDQNTPGMPDITTKPEDLAPDWATKTPGGFAKWKKAYDAALGRETQRQRDDYNKQKDDEANKNKEKGGGGLGPLGWLGAGAAGLALMKYLLGLGHGDSASGGGKRKGGNFVYGSQGQLKGLPTRQKGGNVKEEVEDDDKERRSVELVGRRKGNKKKDALGRHSGIQSRIVDEERRLQIMREAIKDKKDKDKKLKPGEEKTPIDVHPKLKHEPTGHYTQ